MIPIYIDTILKGMETRQLALCQSVGLRPNSSNSETDPPPPIERCSVFDGHLKCLSTQVISIQGTRDFGAEFVKLPRWISIS